MKKASPLTTRFREVLLDGQWVAKTNYHDQLLNLNWQQATHKIGSLNTIAALTFHINYYLKGVLNVFEGGNLEIRDKYSFDAPEIKSDKDWQKLRNSLLKNAEKFAVHIESFPDEKIDGPFVDSKYGSYRRNIDGMIEHCYYHLGQIAIIKKLTLKL